MVKDGLNDLRWMVKKLENLSEVLPLLDETVSLEQKLENQRKNLTEQSEKLNQGQKELDQLKTDLKEFELNKGRSRKEFEESLQGVKNSAHESARRIILEAKTEAEKLTKTSQDNLKKLLVQEDQAHFELEKTLAEVSKAEDKLRDTENTIQKLKESL